MIKRITLLILVFYFTGQLFAQTVTDNMVQQGINEFYAARFEDAIQTLQNAVINNQLSPLDLFNAHLYIAFSLIRQNSDTDHIKLNIIEAIKAKPDVELDIKKIPPDLIQQYSELRSNLLGNLLILTDPTNVSVLLINRDDNKLYNEYSPARFDNLFMGEYDLILAKDEFSTLTAGVSVQPGKTDTLVYTLTKKEIPFYKNWYYIGGAGAALTSILLIWQPWDGGGDGKKPVANLPGPPARPEIP
ncbi:hypothetical protein JW935_25295 [candidate division KSB1 bacterium]|nr:hypothetical protein [candidate division KSB1 bacterium]